MTFGGRRKRQVVLPSGAGPPEAIFREVCPGRKFESCAILRGTTFTSDALSTFQRRGFYSRSVWPLTWCTRAQGMTVVAYILLILKKSHILLFIATTESTRNPVIGRVRIRCEEVDVLIYVVQTSAVAVSARQPSPIYHQPQIAIHPAVAATNFGGKPPISKI